MRRAYAANPLERCANLNQYLSAMISFFPYPKGWLFVLSILTLVAGTAWAQQPRVHSFQDKAPGRRSLEIRNGAVFIDGRQLDPDNLPEGFPPEGAAVEYVFFPGSDEDLKIQVRGGLQYILKGDTLRLSLNNSLWPGFFDAPVLFIPADSLDAVGDLFEQKAEVLFEQAKRMQDLQHRFAEGNTNELQQMMEEMTLYASEAARTASEFPHIQMQRYLQDIQDADQALFDRLIREQRMEREALTMARKFAVMEEGEARRDSIAALRERLTEIFELKQGNRRREVEQLEGKLQELRQAIIERERFRDEIVDRRLKELLGDGTLDW